VAVRVPNTARHAFFGVMTAIRFGPMLAAAAFATCVVNVAHAACGGVTPGGSPTVSEQLSTAKVVFVGTVVYTSDNNRTARVRVESIWKGPDLPAYVDVHGEAPGSGPFSASESDHSYQSGQRYLFAPTNGSPPFADYGECLSLTQAYSPGLAAYAPPDARAPQPARFPEVLETFVGQYWWPTVVLLVIVAAIGLVIVRRRRVERLARDSADDMLHRR
jgi:hypothetical protein